MRDIRSGNAQLEFHAGVDIVTACQIAVSLAKDLNGTVTFIFNGVDMAATGKDKPSELVKRWDSRLEYQGLMNRLARDAASGTSTEGAP